MTVQSKKTEEHLPCKTQSFSCSTLVHTTGLAAGAALHWPGCPIELKRYVGASAASPWHSQTCRKAWGTSPGLGAVKGYLGSTVGLALGVWSADLCWVLWYTQLVFLCLYQLQTAVRQCQQEVTEFKRYSQLTPPHTHWSALIFFVNACITPFSHKMQLLSFSKLSKAITTDTAKKSESPQEFLMRKNLCSSSSPSPQWAQMKLTPSQYERGD